MANYGQGQPAQLMPPPTPQDTVQNRLASIANTLDVALSLVGVAEERMEPSPQKLNSTGDVAPMAGISAWLMRLTQQSQELQKRLEVLANRL